MPLPQKKLIPGLLLALVIAALAAPPLWWSEGNPPVINANPANNHAPANIGQAKHMAKSALEALRPILPAVADQIEADLVGPGNPIPSWAAPANQAEIDQNHAPLLIGQLKAIADPFYTRLHAAAPIWLEAERIANGTNHPNSIFPWTTAATDDNNKGVANIGQLKAVFSLRFEQLDTDHDGLADAWEILHFLNLRFDASADPDNDGLSNLAEADLGSNPNNENTDADDFLDGEDAGPLDPVINWKRTSSPSFAVIPLKTGAGVTNLEFLDVSHDGVVLMSDHTSNPAVTMLSAFDTNAFEHLIPRQSPDLISPEGFFGSGATTLIDNKVLGERLVNSANQECTWDLATNFAAFSIDGYQDDFRDAHHGFYVRTHPSVDPEHLVTQAGSLNGSGYGEAARIEKEGNICTETGYWRYDSSTQSYGTKQPLPGNADPVTQSTTASATLRQTWLPLPTGTSEETHVWNLVVGKTRLLCSKDDAAFAESELKWTTDTGPPIAVTSQGWVACAKKIWVNGKWQPLKEMLGTPLPDTATLLGMVDNGVGVARVEKTGEPPKLVLLIPLEVVPDYNRDGKINQADSGKVTTANPWRWWINDDNDLTTAERGNNLLDVPNRLIEGGLGFYVDWDCHDLLVDGIRDHIDFFPLHFDLKSALEVFPASEYKYVLKHEEEALKYYEYPSCVVDGSEEGYEPNRHVKDVGIGRGLAAKDLKLVSIQGSELSANMLSNLKDEKGVVVIEGAKKTEKPLVLEILKKSDNSSIAEIKFPIRIVSVEDMFRQVNLRDVMEGAGGNPTQTDEPPGYPDDLTNGKYVAYVHGFNISGESARGSQSNIFKRFHQLGSKARYIGISWYGNPPNSFNNLSPPDYHRAAHNGLTTAIVAKSRLGFTQNSELTILAHSLGNSLVGSAIAYHGLEVDHYYIINGAIPLEAYDSAQTSNSSGDPDMNRNMTEDDWKPFYDHGNNGSQHRLLAANWHELFASDPTDNRNKLKWKDIFAKQELLNIAYNFYSPSDEVVENPDDTEEAGDLYNVDDALFGGGRHAWVSQEIAKGGQNWAIAGYTFHDINGGWEFNFNPPPGPTETRGYYKNILFASDIYREYTPEEAANEISDADLRVKPFYSPFLYPALYDPAHGSAIAGVTTNRYKLLGSAIPAMSYAIAANALEKFEPSIGGGLSRNFNMPQELRSPGGYISWPADGNANNPEDWMHSDFKDVALQFIHPMYQKMIDLAELDEE